jgi:hypothetical protein
MRSLSQIVTELEAKRSVVQREFNRLDAAISALRNVNGSSAFKASPGDSSKPRRTMSAAARKKIAAAQRARWAAFKAKQKKAA